MYSFLTAAHAYVRNQAPCFTKVRFRSWRSLLAQLDIFPNEHVRLIDVAISSARRVQDSSRLVKQGVDSVQLIAAHLRTLSFSRDQNGCHVIELAPLLLPGISWERGLGSLFLAILDAKWPRQHSANIPHLEEPIHIPAPFHPYAHLASDIIFWNARTLRPVATAQSKARYRIIKQWLARKSIVVVCETHLARHEFQQLEQELQARVYSTEVAPTCVSAHSEQRQPSVESTLEAPSRKAGVAIILHNSLAPAVLHTYTVLDGYAKLIVFAGIVGAPAPWNGAFVLCAVYVDPNRKLVMLSAIHEALKIWQINHTSYRSLPFIIGGDFNFAAPGTPRTGYHTASPSEHQLTDELDDLCGAAYVHEVYPYPLVPTWRSPGHHGQSAVLDRVFVSQSGLLQATATVILSDSTCFSILSDHSPVCLKLGGTTRSAHIRQGSSHDKIAKLLVAPIGPSHFSGQGPTVQMLRAVIHQQGYKAGYATSQDFGIKCDIRQPVQHTPGALCAGNGTGNLCPSLFLRTAATSIRLWYMWKETLPRRVNRAPTWRHLMRLIRIRCTVSDQVAQEGQSNERPCPLAPPPMPLLHLQAYMRAFCESPGLSSRDLHRSIAVRAALALHPLEPANAALALLDWALKWDTHDFATAPLLPGMIYEDNEGRPQERSSSHKLAAASFPKFVKSPPITSDDTGLPFSTSADEEAALRKSRETLWTRKDWLDAPLQKKWIAAYKANFLANKTLFFDTPSLSLIIEILLKAGRSAPGLDGLPYEAWKIAIMPIARAIHELFAEMERTPGATPFGWQPTVDLTVFIPKAAGLTASSAQRPLSIPETLIRLLSACGIEQIGSTWASYLHQAATALKGKGDCSANVRKLQDFVEWYHVKPTYWQEEIQDRFLHLLPPLLQEVMRQFADIAKLFTASRTLAFVDQVKAYEVIAHEWLLLCWDALPMSTWIWQWLHLVVLNRKVRIRAGTYLGPVLELAKGLGMGGPHAPHMWAVGFDPIVWMLDAAASTYLTTVYADDTSLANCHAEALMFGQLILLAANRTAGLQVAHHLCTSVQFVIAYDDPPLDFSAWIQQQLGQFPLVVANLCCSRDDGVTKVTFNTSSTVFASLLINSVLKLYCETHRQDDKPSILMNFQRPGHCSCPCKCDLLVSPLSLSIRSDVQNNLTALAERHYTRVHLDSQARLMLLRDPMHMLFHGPGKLITTDTWVHYITCLRIAAQTGDPSSDPGALAEGELSVWGCRTVVASARYLGPFIALPFSSNKGFVDSLAKPLVKMTTRTTTAQSIRTSWKAAAYIWNVHIISCVSHIFSAHFATRTLVRPLYALARIALRSRAWTTVDMLAAVTGALGIQGFPVCIISAARSFYCAAGLRVMQAEGQPGQPLYDQQCIIPVRPDQDEGTINLLGCTQSSAAAARRIICEACEPLRFPGDLPERIVLVHGKLSQQLRCELQKANEGRGRIPIIRRLVYRLLMINEAVGSHGGYSQLIQRSKSRTFGRTDGHEWEQLAKFGPTFDSLVVYEFFRLWLNGVADDRRYRWIDKCDNLPALARQLIASQLCVYCGNDPQAIAVARYMPHGWVRGITLCQTCATSLNNDIQHAEPLAPPLWDLIRLRSPTYISDLITQLEGSPRAARSLAALSDEHGFSLARTGLLASAVPGADDCEIPQGHLACRICQLGEFSTEHILWWCPTINHTLSLILERRVDPIVSNPLLLQGVNAQEALLVGQYLRTVMLWISNHRSASTQHMRDLGHRPASISARLIRNWWESIPAKWKPKLTPRYVVQAQQTYSSMISSHIGSATARTLCEHADAVRELAGGLTRPFVLTTAVESPAVLHPQLRSKDVLFVNKNVATGDVIAIVCQTESPLYWPLLGSNGHIINNIRHAIHGTFPTVKLEYKQCPCGATALCLVAVCPISNGDEVTIGFHSPTWTCVPSVTYMSAMYDGSCPMPRAVAPYAGAGIVILHHTADGRTFVVTTIRVSIPGASNAQIAEAVGARTATLFLLTEGRRLLHECGASHFLIRGDSKVVTMDTNGHGTVTARNMSQVILPIKFWLQQAPWIKGFRHVSRAFNSLADHAANEAASAARMLASAPSLPRLGIAQHSMTALEATATIYVQALKQLSLSHRYKHGSSHLKLPLHNALHDNAAAAHLFNIALVLRANAFPSMSPIALAHEIEAIAQQQAPHHTVATSEFLSISLSATLARYLVHSEIPEDQCISLLAFERSTHHALMMMPAHIEDSLRPANHALGKSERVSHIAYLVHASAHSAERDVIRASGLPPPVGEFDENVWAILSQHCCGATIVNIWPTIAIILFRSIAFLYSSIGTFAGQQLPFHFGRVYSEVSCVIQAMTQHPAQEQRHKRAQCTVVGRQLKLALLGHVPAFFEDCLPGRLGVAISTIRAAVRDIPAPARATLNQLLRTACRARANYDGLRTKDPAEVPTAGAPCDTHDLVRAGHLFCTLGLLQDGPRYKIPVRIALGGFITLLPVDYAAQQDIQTLYARLIEDNISAAIRGVTLSHDSITMPTRTYAPLTYAAFLPAATVAHAVESSLWAATPALADEHRQLRIASALRKIVSCLPTLPDCSNKHDDAPTATLCKVDFAYLTDSKRRNTSLNVINKRPRLA